MKPSVFSRHLYNIQLFIIIVFILILASLHIPLNRSIDNIICDFLFKLIGARNLGDNFVFIYLGDEDIKVLAGWPISRDYLRQFRKPDEPEMRIKQLLIRLIISPTKRTRRKELLWSAPKHFGD